MMERKNILQQIGEESIDYLVKKTLPLPYKLRSEWRNKTAEMLHNFLASSYTIEDLKSKYFSEMWSKEELRLRPRCRKLVKILREEYHIPEKNEEYGKVIPFNKAAG